ncbi:hypothetical protein PV689_17530 [Streptomyces sp. ATCC51928]|uniref:Uncharacterized protein n=1 Tax=Streptomyces caviscabies TaxID=90079 RepID=A0ABW2MIK8_9ACTN|nr:MULTISPECIES: hypothetical protein [unclassified Streptomyces]MDX3503717.1 hypothetical protein [Streptomyces sp. ATCC51928]MDX5525685.1 hypothetical protein [Streptomyces sp. DE06-01C]
MPYAELERQQDQVRRGIDLNPGCEADDGLCPTLAVVGETRCALHLGWPLRPGDPLCARCRIAAQRDCDRVVCEWEAVRDAAVAAATAQETHQPHEAQEAAPAPF